MMNIKLTNSTLGGYEKIPVMQEMELIVSWGLREFTSKFNLIIFKTRILFGKLQKITLKWNIMEIETFVFEKEKNWLSLELNQGPLSIYISRIFITQVLNISKTTLDKNPQNYLIHFSH